MDTGRQRVKHMKLSLAKCLLHVRTKQEIQEKDKVLPWGLECKEPTKRFLNPNHKITIWKTIQKNSIRDARTPQPGEIFFNTMRYRSSITVQSSRYFQSSVSYIKVQIMLK